MDLTEIQDDILALGYEDRPKQNVKQLLESEKNSKFVIPEYQRPYSWSDEQIQTLFDDLLKYTKIQNLDSEKESNYFFIYSS